MKASKRAFI